jgi:hypothetical protein
MRRFAAAVVLAAVMFAACSSSGDGYSEDTKQTFLVSCTHNESEPQELCGCIYDEITKQIPFDRYVELDKQMQKDDKFVPDELQRIAADCATRDSSSSSSSSSDSFSS